MKFSPLVVACLMSLQSIVGQAQEITAEMAASDPSLVVIEYGTKVQVFADPQRLSLVLQLLPNTGDVYWPTAQLYDAKAPELATVEQRRSELAEQLRLLTLQAAGDSVLAQQYMALRNQLQHWRLAKPYHEVIRPASAETTAAFNPQLTPGHYILAAAKRNNAVMFVGLGGDFYTEYQSGAPAYAYLDALERNRLPQSEVFYVLRANTPVQQIPVADWNRSEQPLQPGDLVFVPLPDEVLGDYSETFNMQLLELMSYRVMP